MKNSLKQLTSILLAVILLASVFTVLPISAGAEETVAPTVLGDVDGDGDVTILDEIGRASCRERVSSPV